MDLFVFMACEVMIVPGGKKLLIVPKRIVLDFILYEISEWFMQLELNTSNC